MTSVLRKVGWALRAALVPSALVVALTLVSACGSDEESSGEAGTSGTANSTVQGLNACKKPSPTATVKLGMDPTIIQNLPFVIAQERGYFADAGVQVDVETFKVSANELYPQLARGRIDVLSGSLAAPLFNAPGQGFNVKVILAISAEKQGFLGTTSVVARPDALATLNADPASLKDLRVEQISQGSSMSFVINKMLEQAGLLGQVKPTATVKTLGDLVTLFKRDGVDVAPQLQPLVMLMEQQNIAKVYKTAAEITPGLQGSLAVASAEWLEKDPCVAVAFARAYQRAAHDLDASQGAWTPELEQIAAKAWDFPTSQVKALGKTPYAPPDGVVDLRYLTQARDLYAKQGLIDEPVDVEDLVDARITQAAKSGSE